MFRQGDIGTSWYAVLSGSLDVKVSETANHQVRCVINLGRYACSSPFGVSRKSSETHAQKNRIFQGLFYLFCCWAASLFVVRMRDSSAAAFCLLPSSQTQPCRQVPCRASRAGSAHSPQRRHCSVTLAHVPPARKCRSKNHHSTANRSAESRAFCYLLCPLRLGVEMGLQWERKAEDLFLVKDGDKKPSSLWGVLFMYVALKCHWWPSFCGYI